MICTCVDETVCAASCDVPCNGKCKCDGYVMSGQGPSSACVLGKNPNEMMALANLQSLIYMLLDENCIHGEI